MAAINNFAITDDPSGATSASVWYLNAPSLANAQAVAQQIATCVSRTVYLVGANGNGALAGATSGNGFKYTPVAAPVAIGTSVAGLSY